MKKILHCFVETAKKKVTQDRLNKNFKLNNIVVPKIIAELQGFLFFPHNTEFLLKSYKCTEHGIFAEKFLGEVDILCY